MFSKLPEIALMISKKFKSDPTTPGIIMAKIDRGWYLAVHRYTEKFGEGKTVYAKAVNKDLDQCVVELMAAIMAEGGIACCSSSAG